LKILKKIDDIELEIIHQSEEQQYSFNFPVQLANRRHHGSSPSAGLDFKHEVKHNDIIVNASDGLFDNLFKDQVKSTVEEAIREEHRFSSVLIAEKLAEKAGKFAQDKEYLSPFAMRAREQGYHFDGGKVDDTTVVVGRVNLVDENKSNFYEHENASL